jgi:DNA-binding transcriptional ArsR family regulator
MNSTTIAQNPPLMKFETLVTTLGAPVRCAILGALSDGTPRMVNEIAKMIGQKPGLVSKHLAVLRGAGMVTVNRRLYQVPAQYIAAADKRHLDFGHCLLRLPDEKGLPTL